ncbi:MAG: TlpA family protein disulfide reductase [Ruminococcus sp.]|nr:TlpA family protein disulfide reductase [Ruminococcus sp.]
MNNMKKIIAAALLCAVLLCGCSDSESMTDSEMKKELGLTENSAGAEDGSTTRLGNTSGFQSPKSFSATTLEGAEITEAEFARADVTVINIWATTCPPCINEMPELAEFRAELPDNVALWTWCLDGSFYPDLTREIMNDAGFDGITLIAAEGDMASLGSTLMYTPTTIFVDSEGNIMGNAIIGAGNVKQGYTKQINLCLRSMGKEEIK